VCPIDIKKLKKTSHFTTIQKSLKTLYWVSTGTTAQCAFLFEVRFRNPITYIHT